jgi:hypothetical protein
MCGISQLYPAGYKLNLSLPRSLLDLRSAPESLGVSGHNYTVYLATDDIWGSRGRCRVISRSIAEYLVQAWDVRNSCKHNGAVLPLPSAPEGRGADGVDAMA